MEIISYSELRQNLASVMDRVTNDRNPLVITRQKSQPVVMLSLEDFSSLQETLYLLSNPANSEHLRKSIADLEAGGGVEVTLEDI